MAEIDALTDALVGEWLPLPDVADRLGLPIGRVRQLLRDRKLLAVQRPDGTMSVPAAFLEDGHIVMPDLPGIGFEGKSDLYAEMKALAS